MIDVNLIVIVDELCGVHVIFWNKVECSSFFWIFCGFLIRKVKVRERIRV